VVFKTKISKTPQDIVFIKIMENKPELIKPTENSLSHEDKVILSNGQVMPAHTHSPEAMKRLRERKRLKEMNETPEQRAERLRKLARQAEIMREAKRKKELHNNILYNINNNNIYNNTNSKSKEANNILSRNSRNSIEDNNNNINKANNKKEKESQKNTVKGLLRISSESIKGSKELNKQKQASKDNKISKLDRASGKSGAKLKYKQTAKNVYVHLADKPTYRQFSQLLEQKYGFYVSPTALSRWIRAEGNTQRNWEFIRQRNQALAEQKVIEKLAEKRADEIIDSLPTINSALSTAKQALEEALERGKIGDVPACVSAITSAVKAKQMLEGKPTEITAMEGITLADIRTVKEALEAVRMGDIVAFQRVTRSLLERERQQGVLRQAN